MCDYNEKFIRGLNDKLKDYNKQNNGIRLSRFISNKDSKVISIVGEKEDNLDEFFGVLPEMSIEKIKEDLIQAESSPLLNKDDFEKYFKANREVWSWGSKTNDDEKLKIALLGKCILAVTHEFSVEIRYEAKDILSSLQEDLNNLKIYYVIDKDKKTLKIHGRLTLEQCERLNSSYSLIYIDNNIQIVAVKDGESHDNLIEWIELYKKLKCSHYLYSGVNTNVKSIKINDTIAANPNISIMKVEVCKTSYATVLGLGHPKLTKSEGKLYKNYLLRDHPLLSEYIKELTEFDEEELKLQSVVFRKLANSELSTEQFVDEVNKYLEQSNFPHIISIAGNIITSDNYCLYIKRGDDVEQEGKESCAITGYSEVYDKEVNFYKHSVEDDKPSIKSLDLFNFGGEFARETRAELGISTQCGDWKYYGIIVSGKDDKEDQPSTVDFEVFGQADVNYSLEQIIKSQKKSIEKAENRGVYGLKINLCENKKERVKLFLNGVINWIVENKDLIIIAFLIYPFISKLTSYFTTEASRQVALMISWDYLVSKSKETIELIINICLIIIFVSNLYKKYQSKKQKNSIYVIKDKVLIKDIILKKDTCDLEYVKEKIFGDKITNLSYLSVIAFHLYLLEKLKD